MKNYTIIPLDVEHIEEICNDIKYQIDAGFAECPLFSLQLQPWGNPPVNKTDDLCEKYDLFRDRLGKMGIECGILVQSSMANASSETPFQKFINLRTGEKLAHLYCPSDQGFREFMKKEMEDIAKHNPAVIMLDDDIRLLTHRAGSGCCCELHLKEFNHRAGTDMTREELFDVLSTDENSPYAQIFLDVQRDSLVDYVKYMRAGVDSVNPKIQGAYCTVGGEWAAEISTAFAGENNPVILRINNGNYGSIGLKPFSWSMMRAALQVTSVKGKVDVILAETDTCPHNRYSKSAHSLHAHFVGSILEGAQGAKHWLQRTGVFEPDSGKAYRKILEKHTGFYNKLIEIVPKLDFTGCRIPITNKVNFDFSGSCDAYYPQEEGWSFNVWERMGIPFYYSSEDGGVVCINGNRDKSFSDEEIKKMLSGEVFLASDTAKNLINRGFGEHLGVDIREWNGDKISCELIGGKRIQAQIDLREIVLMDKEAEVDSENIYTDDMLQEQIAFPATTVYKNSLGGTVNVFCGTPKCGELWSAGYSFLNETRKLQLIRLLENMGSLQVYYPGDAEVYMKAAKMDDEKNTII